MKERNIKSKRIVSNNDSPFIFTGQQSTVYVCISQLKPRPPDSCSITGCGRDLTWPAMQGFNTHLTTCCPWGGVRLTRCLFNPGHECGFNAHAFLELGTATGNCILLFFRNSCFRASTPFKICGSVQVFRSSNIVFLHLAVF